MLTRPKTQNEDRWPNINHEHEERMNILGVEIAALPKDLPATRLRPAYRVFITSTIRLVK